MTQEEQERAKKERMAKLLLQMEEFFDKDGGYSKFDERVKAVEDLFGDEGSLKGLTSKDIAEKFEELKASHKRITQAIKTSKRGAYVPGLEDEADNFSIVKAVAGYRTKDWSNAGFEKEAMDAAAEARYKATGQVAGDNNRGGNFIPDQVIPDVIAAIYGRSQFIAMDGEGETRVSTLDGLPGGRITIPQFHGGMIAYWMGEEDPFTLSEVKTDDIAMDLKKLGVLARLTDTMMRYGGMGFEKLLRKDMVKAAVKKIDTSVAFGNGGNHAPKGLAYWDTGGHPEAGTDDAGNAVGPGIKIFNAGTGSVITYAAAKAASFGGGTVGFDALAAMRLAFEEDDIDTEDPSFATISSPRFFDGLKRTKVDNYSGQSTNQPYLIGIPYLPDSRLRELIGAYGKMNKIKSAQDPGDGGSGAAIFSGANTNKLHTGLFMGDMSQVIFGRGSGFEIEDDAGKGTGFTTDSTYVKLRMYADVAVRQPRALMFCPDVKVR